MSFFFKMRIDAFLFSHLFENKFLAKIFDFIYCKYLTAAFTVIVRIVRTDKIENFADKTAINNRTVHVY